jgi:hypothetical protein
LVLDSVSFALPLLFGDKVTMLPYTSAMTLLEKLEPASESYLAGPIFWKSKGRLTCQDQSPLCGMVCLLGDAAHPMMPDQNQGFSQAIEDAGALGLIFWKEHAKVIGQKVRLGLEL